LRWQGSAIGKNGVFNSGYDVFQRASVPTTGVTTAGTIAYSLDRWVSWTTGGGGSVVTSQQTVGDTTNLPFVRYCARFRRSTSNTSTDALYFGQTLENTDSARFIGQTVTYSFYARKGANYSPTSSLMGVVLFSNTTTDAGFNTVSGSGSSTPISTTATLTTTWQRFQYTATVASTATQLAFGFYMIPTGTAGAADYFEVTGVQLELGSIATPFAKMGAGTIQGELAACQRYYQITHVSIEGYAVGSQNNYTPIAIPVTMRTAPTITTTGGSGSNYSARGAGRIFADGFAYSITASSTGNRYILDDVVTMTSEL
jgi:hypothetical protein